METLAYQLHQVIERDPGRIAVVDASGETSYGDLRLMIESLAGALLEKGFQKGDRVSLLMENSARYIAAYYAVLWLGGVVVALNTAVKKRDIENWIGHSDSRLLVADSKHPELAKLAVPGLEIIPAEDITNSESCASKAIPLPEKVADDTLAAIIYTSGTTGKPKGVMLSQKNLSANVGSIQDYLGITDQDTVVNVLPFYYSYGNSVLHTHLTKGAKLVLENSLLYPARVLESMERNAATMFSGVPSTFTLLLSRTNMGKYNLDSLRTVTQAGGPMTVATTEALQKVLPASQIVVMYGQTEATARLSYLPPERLVEKIGSIGFAIPGVELSIRDRQGQELATGQKGEIWARGNNIMQGYWKEDELTRTVLTDDGWLKTGDLARQDEAGFIYIVGRQSDMIKSGAHRISPKDIEEVIAELDIVEEVAVVGVADEMLGQVIKACIIPKNNGEQPDKRQIMAFCKQNLAIYKMPKQLEFYEQFPRTPSGKVKKYLLV